MVSTIKIHHLKHFFLLKLNWTFEISRCFFYLFILIICNLALSMGPASDLFNCSTGTEGELGLQIQDSLISESNSNFLIWRKFQSFKWSCVWMPSFTYCFWGAGLWAGDLTTPGGRDTGVTWGDLDTGPVTTGLGLEPGVPYNIKQNHNDVYLYGDVCSDFNDIIALRADNHLITNFHMKTIEWLMITRACGYL